jgi:hypothetical protein
LFARIVTLPSKKRLRRERKNGFARYPVLVVLLQGILGVLKVTRES